MALYQKMGKMLFEKQHSADWENVRGMVTDMEVLKNGTLILLLK